ncbi:MAG: 50S ribosomal protein L29 [Patescibacteria group bacterium]
MTDLKTKDIAELQKELADKREALRVFRFEGAGSRSRDVRGGRNLRKDIARLLTELNSRKVSQ